MWDESSEMDLSPLKVDTTKQPSIDLAYIYIGHLQ